MLVFMLSAENTAHSGTLWPRANLWPN